MLAGGLGAEAVPAERCPDAFDLVRRDGDSDSRAAGLPQRITEGLGGRDNIQSLDSCATRLRVTVKDPDLVDEGILRETGAAGVIRKGGGVQIIYGPTVTVIKSELDEYLGAE